MKIKKTAIKATVLSLGLSFYAHYIQAQVSHNQVLDMDFEGGIVDSSSQNQATSISGTHAFTSDRWNNSSSALLFIGPTDPAVVSLTNTSGTYKVNFPATLSAWVQLNTMGTVVNPIVTTEDDNANNSGLSLDISSQGAVMATYGNNSPAGATARKTFQTVDGMITAGSWNHIVAVFNSASSVDVYVNGMKRSTTSSGGATACVYNYNNPGKIGSYIKGGINRVIDGRMDKIKIYSAALTQDEILALFYNKHDNHTSLLFNYGLNNNYGDQSIFNRASGSMGMNAYTTDRAGNANRALAVSLSSGVEIQEPAGEFKCNFPMTFSTWIKINSIGAVPKPIFANNDRNNAYSGLSIMQLPSGNLYVSIGDGGGTGSTNRKSYSTNSTIPTNQWVHLAVVLKPASLPNLYTTEVYFDGVSQLINLPSGTGSSLSYTTSGTVYARMGACFTGSGSMSAIDASMDDVMFWDVALTPAEITDLGTNYIDNNPTVSIAKNVGQSSGINVFPNPNSGTFTIKTTYTGPVKIINVIGQEVHSFDLKTAGASTLTLSHLPDGIYYLMGEGISEKIIINK
ncbi:MAG TPA: LamG-like jellyroll fold domain-containing protein [Bacteroidia bacterium]